MVCARICKADVSGSSYVDEREVATYKKMNIESSDVFKLFENTKTVMPNQISTTLQRMPKSFQVW